MKCPVCADATLHRVLTTQGVEIDRCPACRGVWLERGEIFLFATKARSIAAKLERALADQKPTDRLSPASGEPMTEIVYPGGPRIDRCPRSGGLWFDAGELKALLGVEPGIRLAIDRTAASIIPQAGARTEAPDGGQARRPDDAADAAGAGMVALPNLLLRSTATLAGLYGLLVLVVIAAVEFAGVDLAGAVMGALIVIILQFLIGPFLMDLSLRWLYKLRWLEPEELPDHLRAFVARISDDHGIKHPRFAMIDDGAPQAFTYGHTPNNARIVLSRGIFELLGPEEAEAVVAHEIGHAVHWDMFLMTVAQLVPLIFYYLYRTLIRMKSSGKNKGGGARIAIAVGAYVLYMISQYVVLWFSRTREYHADRFAGAATGNPSLIASALVKIAYGLAGQDKEDEDEAKRDVNLGAISAMGIFDAGAAQALAISSYSANPVMGGALDKKRLKGAMRWDLWNPWAKWYEFNSTHPLIANRLRYLSNQAEAMGLAPYVRFDEAQPESYWDEFFADLAIHLMPAAALLAVIALAAARYLFDFTPARSEYLLPLSVALLGGAMLLRFEFAYRADFFAEMSIAALLKKVKVSAVRPVPCRLEGVIIGRGVPGYIFSEDFVMRDETGIIFLDYRQPLAIWEWFFGLLKAGGFQGANVTVEGWYRRAPVPYIELRTIRRDGKVTKSWVAMFNRLGAVAITAAGMAWAAAAFLGFAPF